MQVKPIVSYKIHIVTYLHTSVTYFEQDFIAIDLPRFSLHVKVVANIQIPLNLITL